MPQLKIYATDHRPDDHQPKGNIIETWHVHPEDAPGDAYADYTALFGAWLLDKEPDLIGFFGYRKYLWPSAGDWATPAHAPNWYQCDKESFDKVRRWLAANDGAYLKLLLAQHDILQASPFPLQVNMITDFAMSRSEHDADVLRDVLRKQGWPSSSGKIYPYIFITRWAVFERMMREMEPVRQRMDALIMPVETLDNKAYVERPMAYIMERVYSQWLQQSGLDIKELPMLHCWEM